MITAISKFRLRPGLTRQTAIEEIKETIPVYQGRPGLVRKYICLDFDNGYGCGIYLWETRQQAEQFFTFARAKIREQTGSEPEITLLETPVIVDNLTGTIEIAA